MKCETPAVRSSTDMNQNDCDKQNTSPLEVGMWSGGYSSTEQIWSSPFLPLANCMSVINSYIFCLSVQPSVKQEHIYRANFWQASLVDAGSPVLSGTQDFSSEKYKSLTHCQDTEYHSCCWKQLYTYNQMWWYWLKNLFILLAVLKDFELNLTQTSETSSSLGQICYKRSQSNLIF